MKEFEKKEAMTYESRIALVRENFCKQMGLLYQPHTHLKEGEAAAIYMKEVCEAINSRISADVPNSDSYKELLRTIWRTVTSKQKSRFWFNLADIISATNAANRAWEARHGTKKAAKVFGGQAGAEEVRKKGEGWSLEGAKKALAETDRQIASGELARGMGELLRRIPLKAIERLGGDADIAPPAKQETPPEHLPDDSGKINMDLIKAGHTAPVFDPFDLAEPLDDPLPDSLKAPLPDFNQI
jgi:hypothetical protein